MPIALEVKLDLGDGGSPGTDRLRVHRCGVERRAQPAERLEQKLDERCPGLGRHPVHVAAAPERPPPLDDAAPDEKPQPEAQGASARSGRDSQLVHVERTRVPQQQDGQGPARWARDVSPGRASGHRLEERGLSVPVLP